MNYERLVQALLRVPMTSSAMERGTETPACSAKGWGNAACVADTQHPVEGIMAGIFGDHIHCRADFEAELDQVSTYLERVMQTLPHERLLDSVLKQLKTIQGWTVAGAAPTPDERARIVMGVQMYREYEMTDDLDLYRLRGRVGSLNNYVTHWPNDKVAADPNNDAYL